MDRDIDKILITSEQIQTRILELGAQIAREYTPLGDLLLVGVLKGCVMFMVDLARAIPLPLALDFIATSSYGHSTEFERRGTAAERSGHRHRRPACADRRGYHR